MSEPLATLYASSTRRIMAISMQGALGGLLIYAALSNPISVGLQIGLMLFGGIILWLALELWRATQRSLILTDDGLYDDTGKLLVRLDQIKEVQRSPFAIKPSNGFALVLYQPGPRSWHPGLWWQWGRRIAVGGVTPGSQGKFMADQIALYILRREGRI
jgi:hypothetical protein